MSQNTEPTPAEVGGIPGHKAGTDTNTNTNTPVPAVNTPDLSDTILEVRLGKMKLMPGLKIQSGIDKQLVDGAVQVGPGGIEGDEHDYTFHGGPEKAIHACKR